MKRVRKGLASKSTTPSQPTNPGKRSQAGEVVSVCRRDRPGSGESLLSKSKLKSVPQSYNGHRRASWCFPTKKRADQGEVVPCPGLWASPLLPMTQLRPFCDGRGAFFLLILHCLPGPGSGDGHVVNTGAGRAPTNPVIRHYFPLDAVPTRGASRAAPFMGWARALSPNLSFSILSHRPILGEEPASRAGMATTSFPVWSVATFLLFLGGSIPTHQPDRARG